MPDSGWIGVKQKGMVEMKLTELLTDVIYHTALDDIEIADVDKNQ